MRVWVMISEGPAGLLVESVSARRPGDDEVMFAMYGPDGPMAGTVIERDEDGGIVYAETPGGEVYVYVRASTLDTR